MQKRTAEWLKRGASAIIALNALHCRTVYDREELIVADLDLNEIDHEVLTLDVPGITLSVGRVNIRNKSTITSPRP